METKHTKGVWKVEDSLLTGCTEVSFGDFQGGVELWHHHGGTLTKEEAEANAKLIAAAPELLTACIEAIDIIREIGNWNDDVLIEEMQTAIKKATE